MIIIYLYLLVSLISSVLIIPAVIKLQILDLPNERKIHSKVMPKAGGLGIFIPVIFLLLYNYAVKSNTHYNDYIVISSSLLILMITGLIDDKKDISAKKKLLFQLIASVITVFSGIRFYIFSNIIADYILSIIWIVGIINAVNLIDGLDGLAAGIGIISCGCFCILGYKYDAYIIKLISLMLIGSSSGFLFYNFRPAKIFMGDTGSLPLGYILAVLGLFSTKRIGGFTSIYIPIIILGIPIYDTLLSIFRRKINNRSIFAPDRNHFYNLLMDIKGLSHVKTVLTLYAISAILCFVSLYMLSINNLYKTILFCLIIFISIIFTQKLGFIHVDDINNKTEAKS